MNESKKPERKHEKRPSRPARKKGAQKDPPVKNLREELQKKLKEKRLSRSSYHALDTRMEKIEELLENTDDKDLRKKLKKDLKLLEKVEEDQLNRVNGDPAEYGDNAGYGGSMPMTE